MSKPNKYDFSFTGTSLRVNDMVRVAQARIDQIEFDFVRHLGKGNSRTAIKHFREINKRLDQLTEKELEVLAEGSLEEQKQMALLGFCKAHLFVRDFVVEVLRDKMLVFDDELTENDYLSFWRKKSALYTDMEDLSIVTKKKIEQVIYRILEQADIINNTKEKRIQAQWLGGKVKNVISEDTHEWLKLFFLSDHDIKEIRT